MSILPEKRYRYSGTIVGSLTTTGDKSTNFVLLEAHASTPPYVIENSLIYKAFLTPDIQQ